MLFGSLRHEFDPLDREILERAFYAAWAAIEERAPSAADERRAAILRCKLIEVADTNRLNDAEALRDIVLGELFGPALETDDQDWSWCRPSSRNPMLRCTQSRHSPSV